MRCALYARVSTLKKNDRKEPQQDPEMQLREMREYCLRMGYEITDEFVDAGVSGAKSSRLSLDRLMAGARDGEFDIVLVWRIDRFGRSLRHLLNAISELESRHVTFVSLKDNIDLSTPTGRLLFNILGSVAEFEREVIRERVKSGMANARSKGKRISRPRKDIDLARLAELRRAGMSQRECAELLSISAATVCRRAA